LNDYIEVVAAIVGVILGFALSEVVGWIRRNAEARQRAEAVRAILRIEIDRNRRELEAMLKSNGVLPVQSNQIWESQLRSGANALTATEIERVHDFYYELYLLKKVPAAELQSAVTKFLSKPHPL
jgi:type II secretory pathway pseudopilin PulG